MVKGKLEKTETDGTASISYGRQFHITGAALRKAHDSIFVLDEHGSNFLPSADDVSALRKILYVMRNLRYVGSPDSRSLYVTVATL